MSTVQFELGCGASIALPASVVAENLIKQLQKSSAPQTQARPEIGKYLPGQGGIYVGDIKGDDGVTYGLIMSQEQDIGKAKWGYENQNLTLSLCNGLENTRGLYNSPAAKLAFAHEADGHADFYLPSRHELVLASVNVFDQFNKDSWYWSSTPYGEYSAWAVGFENGTVHFTNRHYEFRVRPFRRFIHSAI